MPTYTFGAVAGNWSDPMKWSGMIVPTSADDVVFDANSGDCTLDIYDAVCKSLNCNNGSAYAGVLSYNGQLTIYGNHSSGILFRLSSAMTLTLGNPNKQLVSRADNSSQLSMLSAGKTLGTFSCFPGETGSGGFSDLLLLDTLSVTDLYLTNCSFDTGGHDVNLTGTLYAKDGTAERTWNFQDSVISIGGTATFRNNSNLTLNPGTSNIVMSSASWRNFFGAGLTFYDLTVTGDNIHIYDSSTFHAIALNNAGSANGTVFGNGTTQSVTNLTSNGTSGNLVVAQSDSAGNSFSLSKASGTVSLDYLSLKDSHAVGGASWYAGTHSTDLGGNSGWSFTSGLNHYSLTADVASFASTGNAAVLLLARKLSAASGVFTESGQPVGVMQGRRITVAVAVFVATANEASLVFSPNSSGDGVPLGSGVSVRVGLSL